GELEAGKGKVLFEKVLKDGSKDEYDNKPIDISKDILKIIENNKEIIEKIKEVTKVVVEKGKGDLPTGEVINGKAVYKGIATVEVKDTVGYDSTFQGFITAAPKKVEINDKGVAEIKDSTDEFGRLLRVSIIDAAGNVLINSATNVTSPSKNQFNFYFGMGEMYVPLDNAANYEVVYEYIAK
ncbi:MAG: hypothetical protein LBE34_04250, partial [Flavobacteriaceae bacterium]|nr:hypothetical protein [Flavobacteriaceae bacterium]